MQEAPEVFSWLQPFWNFGANLTSLVNWEALGAIGTVGTLYWAVRLASRADVRQAQRDRVQLLSAALLLDTFFTHIPDEGHVFENEQVKKAYFIATLECWQDDNITARIYAFDTAVFPTTSSMSEYSLGVASAALLVEQVGDPNHADWEINLDEVWAEARDLRRIIDALRFEAFHGEDAGFARWSSHYGSQDNERIAPLNSFVARLNKTWSALPRPWRSKKTSIEE